MNLSSKRLILLRLEEYFAIHNISSEATFLVAFSGGCDSLCLLSSLSLMFPGLITACYVNHKIRSNEELEVEEKLNIDNCKKLKVPLIIRRLDDGAVQALAKDENISIEASARALRYKELEIVRKQANIMYLATAHTLSDQTETVLMRLYTGSTFQALSGISPRSDYLLRPLINVRREDTEGYCKQMKLTYSTDSTNKDVNYLRNHLRFDLLPVIKELSPSIENKLLSIAKNVKEIIGKEEVLPISNKGAYSQLDISSYNTLSIVGKSRALIEFASPYFEGRVSSGVIKELNCLLQKGSGRLEYDGCFARCRKDKLVLFPKLFNFVKVIETLPTELSGNFYLEKGTQTTDLSIDSSLIYGKMVMRLSQEGDIICLNDKISLVSDIVSSQKLPYAFVLEDQKGIIALFMTVFGGRDRLSKRFLSIAPNPENLYSVIYRI